MKCPKCGSNNIKVVYECSGWNEKGLGKFEQCRDCHTAINEYQARLDKVLSKFKYFKGDEYVYKNFISYYKNSNKFYISEDIPNPSLETVESLLRDLNVL